MLKKVLTAKKVFQEPGEIFQRSPKRPGERNIAGRTLIFLCLFMVWIALARAVWGAPSPQPVSQPATSWAVTGRTIVVDPGHGGPDPGTVGSRGTLEKNITLVVSKRLATLLNQAGARVVLTRDADADLSDPRLTDPAHVRVQDLSRRVDLANKAGADILVSIHLNHFRDPAEYGAQAFYHPGRDRGRKLAETIQAELNRTLSDAGRQALPGDFYLCRHARMPAVIVEVGFLSHPGEEKKLNAPAYQQQAASAVFAGIVRYFSEQG